MSERITITEVRRIWTEYVKECEKAGFDTTGWSLEEGSTTYGRAFRAFTGGHRDKCPGTGWNGYLGSTRREAYVALERMHAVLYDLRHRKA